jgi:hypothetical protein
MRVCGRSGAPQLSRVTEETRRVQLRAAGVGLRPNRRHHPGEFPEIDDLRRQSRPNPGRAEESRQPRLRLSYSQTGRRIGAQLPKEVFLDFRLQASRTPPRQTARQAQKAAPEAFSSRALPCVFRAQDWMEHAMVSRLAGYYCLVEEGRHPKRSRADGLVQALSASRDQSEDPQVGSDDHPKPREFLG